MSAPRERLHPPQCPRCERRHPADLPERCKPLHTPMPQHVRDELAAIFARRRGHSGHDHARDGGCLG